MSAREVPVSFLCGEDRLYGIVHEPDSASECGVLMLPGRPALRTGRHRLFVLLARAWAEAGIPVMRFDYRGAGDCEGKMGTLDETSADVASAVDAFLSSVPGLQRIILWGLCVGAADSLLYGPRDSRVAGIVLVNPWFYDARLRTLVKIRRAGLRYLGSVRHWLRPSPGRETFVDDVAAEGFGLTSPAEDLDASMNLEATAVDQAYGSYRAAGLSRRLAEALEIFHGRVLLILSGGDTGAQAFKRMASISWKWRRLLAQSRVESHELPEANHSLRRPEWRGQVADWTVNWLREI